MLIDETLYSADVRSVLLAKGPDSSISGVPVGSCLDEVHMEEEKVEIKVQAEGERGEKHWKEQSEEKGREQTITQAHDTLMG